MSEKGIEDLATSCIRCGFCLEACPTFVLTGEETESPRGRIYLARSAERGTVEWESIRPHMDRCLGCLACQTACPSGVQYGALIELAWAKLEAAHPNRSKRRLLGVLTEPGRVRWMMRLATWSGLRKAPGFLARGLSAEPQTAELPSPSLAARSAVRVAGKKGEVLLLEGCAMREMFPGVHDATRRLLGLLGYEVAGVDLGCCGALEAHGGLLSEGQARREKLLGLAAGRPIVVNSAGCGSWLKEGDASIRDVSEFLLENGLAELLGKAEPKGWTITYHDACHLAHGQGVREAPRTLLQAIPGVSFVELDEADRCCGSAGIYNLTQPTLSHRLLERKVERVLRTGSTIVALGNPGCHAWIAQGLREARSPVEVLHTVEVLARALG